MNRQKLLVIVGPTSVGKTELSLSIAERLDAEIISADSMQVYRGMDIGTAKASLAEQERVPHHLLDVVDPDQTFNVADYVSLSEKVLAQLQRKRKTPVITGGTGLYIDALLDGFLFPDTSADPKIRKQLEEEAKVKPTSLHEELSRVDPVSAKKIHPNDLRRIIRALEVYRRTGEAISELQKKKHSSERPYKPLYIGLNRNRLELYDRVNKRVDQMLQAGLVAEVQGLLDRYPQQPTALQALGYKEIVWYLRGEKTLQESVELLKRDTRRYAKRQLSWFRRNQRIHWFNLSELSESRIVQRIETLWDAFV